LTTTLVSARASGHTPPTSTSPREDSIRRHSKKYHQKANIKERAFLASLSNLDQDSDDAASSSSNEETERWVEDKLNGLCFIADTIGGLCTRALGDDAVGGG
jgi:hypothetical protein